MKNLTALAKEELKYLIIIVEKDLEEYNSFENMTADEFKDMLYDLYSKLIITNLN